MHSKFALKSLLVCAFALVSFSVFAQPGSPVRSSLVEDRAARKLLEAGDTRFEAEELKKAVEIWQSVIERYPRSRVRFGAHMRLGNFFLDRDRAYDRARVQFESVITDENRDEAQQAEATLKMGVCFYQARNFGKCFQVMRDVIEKYPVHKQVNEAYYYIGLGHFQLGHYSRAILALEKVGTTLANEEGRIEKVEAGKRLFVKIEDADLSALDQGQTVKVRCEATSGDVEIVDCFSVGRNVRIVLGSIPSRLGKPQLGNGKLEVKGDDKVKVTYVDQHTADKKFDQKVLKEVSVVGDGVASITDGAFNETLRGVVLGKSVNIQISDPDRDLTDDSDKLTAYVDVYRAKTDEEIEAETIELLKKEDATAPDTSNAKPLDGEEEAEPKIDRFKRVDRVAITLNEVKVERKVTNLSDDREPAKPAEDGAAPPATNKPVEPAAKPEAAKPEAAKPEAAKPQATEKDSAAPEPQATDAKPEPADPIDDNSIHSGVFRTTVSLAKVEEVVADDEVLQALPGDLVRITYLDERNSTDGISEVLYEARCIEGNLGGVRVTKSSISDKELRIRTQLKTADALTNIGNRYKEFGLKKNADAKYAQALQICEQITGEASRLGGRLLEETYVQLWHIYFQMDRLELAAAMAQRLQRDFPNSGFVDDALLQLADVARKQGNTQRAIGIYSRLVNMQTSQLRGEAQFGIAQCYEQMAEAAPNEQAASQLNDRAFQEYKKVFDSFPDSGRVGEAVSRMANYYYRQKDYGRAVDTFETVLSDYPDAKFLDVILFNYGRCLYRMNRKADARRKFDQLIGDYPESTLATDAKKISDALSKSGL